MSSFVARWDSSCRTQMDLLKPPGRAERTTDTLAHCHITSEAPSTLTGPGFGGIRLGLLRDYFFRCLVAPRMFFGACEHQHGIPDRASGVLIMRHFSKCVDRVTHRKLSSGPVPEQGRHSYSCNLGPEPGNSRNCKRSCAEVVQNRVWL